MADKVTIPFLKVGVDEAVKALDESIIKGYKIYYDKIASRRVDYGHGDPDIAVKAVNDGNREIDAWNNETYQILQSVYSSQREALNFLTVRPGAYEIIGIPANLSSAFIRVECKLDYLNKLIEYILHRSNIQFYSHRDLFVQIDSPKSKQEAK